MGPSVERDPFMSGIIHPDNKNEDDNKKFYELGAAEIFFNSQEITNKQTDLSKRFEMATSTLFQTLKSKGDVNHGLFGFPLHFNNARIIDIEKKIRDTAI